MLSSRARTEEAKHDRRKLLLRAALDEFYEQGFTAARIDDIASRAGVSKGTVYLYFESKEAIFFGLIEDMTLPNIDRIEQIAAAAPSIHLAIANIANLGPYIIRETDLPKLMKVMIGQSRSFPDIVEHYRENVLERLLGVVEKMLKTAKERGEIDFDDAAITARLIMAPMMFAGVWTGVFGNEGSASLDIEKLLSTHARNMLKALAPQEDS